jgi:hypothetical protein
MKFWQLMTIGVVLGLIWVGGCKTGESYTRTNFYAHMTGDQEVPSTTTKGHGEFTMETRDNGDQVYYKLQVGQLENVTAAHIHLGKAGENGAPVVMLFQGPKKKGEFNGVLAEGTFTRGGLVGPLEGRTISELVDEIRRGKAYVNVHTDKYPEGELRGQIQ